jgi:hypothetical protein
MADQNRILGINRRLGTEYPKLIKQAKGVKTMAEAYKACAEKIIG